MYFDKQKHMDCDCRQLYCVVDTKAGQFLAPFEARNNATAVRSFIDSYRGTQGIFHDHVEDFALFHVGAQSIRNGVIYPLEIPSVIYRGYELLISPEKPAVEPSSVEELSEVAE